MHLPAFVGLAAAILHAPPLLAETDRVDLSAVVECRLQVERLLHDRRDWPASNPGAKPAFESLVTRHEMETAVAELLDRAPPIGREALQAELERMARQTRDPSLLDEFFAVARDGQIAALCLALPNLAARAERTPDWRDEAGAIPRARLDAPKSAGQGADEPDFREDPPDPRFGHAAVWTGVEMIVFGGSNSQRSFSGGARYLPATDTWIALPGGGPSARTLASAVWTGLDVIVFGGHDPAVGVATSHARYRPSNDLWGPVATAGAPAGRFHHAAVWTGSSMIVFGGTDGATVFADGGIYSPASNSWQALPAPPPGNARNRAAAAWTGTEMLVHGGYSGTSSGVLASGLRYLPGSPGSWTTMAAATPPGGRAGHTGLWFGPPVSRFVVWGGETSSTLSAPGGLYDPALDAWTPMSTAGAPAGRVLHTGVSAGSEMIVWGGTDTFFASLDDGARYSPAANTWTGVLQDAGNPGARHGHSAVWTGEAMIVWGGLASTTPLHTGGVYLPASDAWRATASPRPCSSMAGNRVPNCGFESGTAGWSGLDGSVDGLALDLLVHRGGLASARVSGQSGFPRLTSPCFAIDGGSRYDFGVSTRINRADPGCTLSLRTSTTADCSVDSTSSIANFFPLVYDDWIHIRQASHPAGPFDVAARLVLSCGDTVDPSSHTLHADDAFVLALGINVFRDGFE